MFHETQSTHLFLLFLMLLVLHLHEFDRRLGPPVDVQFLVNLFEMPADGFDRDAETVGDFLVGGACGKALQHLGLPAGKGRGFATPPAFVAE